MDSQNNQQEIIDQPLVSEESLEAIPPFPFEKYFTIKPLAQFKLVSDALKKTGLFNLGSNHGLFPTSWKIQSLTDKQTKQFGQCLNDLQSIQANNLQILSCGFYNILNHLSPIKFDHIKELSLYGNNIISIEIFQNMALQTLVNLRLDNNHITNLKSFRKFNFPSLQQLDLQNNGFNELQHIQQMNAPQFQIIRLQDWNALNPTNDNKAWICKLGSSALNYIRCPNPRRLKQDKLDSMLRLKYSNLNIMRHNGNS